MDFAKDCASALRVLKEVEVKEGAVKPVLAMEGQVYACLGNPQDEAKNSERLRDIRIFISANDS